MESKLSTWQADNEKETREYCEVLLSVLKNEHLDPVLEKLQSKAAAQVSFSEVISEYHKIKDDYEKDAKGAKDVIAAVFFEFHPVRKFFLYFTSVPIRETRCMWNHIVLHPTLIRT